jgi:hypothetical protein
VDQPDPAIGRFWLLQLIRLGGIVMVLTGAMAVAGRLRLTEGQGAVLMVGGAIAFFFLPVLLVKHWKSQE